MQESQAFRDITKLVRSFGYEPQQHSQYHYRVAKFDYWTTGTWVLRNSNIRGKGFDSFNKAFIEYMESIQ